MSTGKALLTTLAVVMECYAAAAWVIPAIVYAILLWVCAPDGLRL